MLAAVALGSAIGAAGAAGGASSLGAAQADTSNNPNPATSSDTTNQIRFNLDPSYFYYSPHHKLDRLYCQ